MKLVLQGRKHQNLFVNQPTQLVLISSVFGKWFTGFVERRNFMTTNQVAYAKVKEDTRHNTETEQIERSKAASQASQADSAARQARVAELAQEEAARHNREGERVNWFSALSGWEESVRHNKETESVNWFNAQTTRDTQTRQAAVSERLAHVQEGQLGVAQEQLKLNARDTASREKQASASQTQAAASMIQASASRDQATASLLNAQTQQSALAESIRHNQIVEQETFRNNLAMASAAQTQAIAATQRAQSAQLDSETRAAQLPIMQQQAEASSKQAATSVFRSITDAGFKAGQGIQGVISSQISGLANSFSLIWRTAT